MNDDIELIDRYGVKNTIGSDYIAIYSDGTVRWIFFNEYEKFSYIFNECAPQRFIKIIQWKILSFFLFIGIKNLGRFLVQKRVEKVIELIDFGIVNAVYIGGRNDFQKYIVFATRSNKKFIAKLPKTDDSKRSIRNEVNILRKLNVDILPRITRYEDCISEQTFIHGKPSAKILNSKHFELLRRFPRNAQLISINEIIINTRSNKVKNNYLIDSLLGLIKNQFYRITFEHGDFTPWNIKEIETGEYTIYDFEFSEMKSVPFMDVIHFTFAVEVFICRNYSTTIILNKLLALSYLKELNFIYDDKLTLDHVIIYIVKAISKRLSANLDGNDKVLDLYFSLANKIIGNNYEI